MNRTICIANQKGGVGKTTTAINLGSGLAGAGLSTLLIDLDPQCNSTHYLLGQDLDVIEKDIGDFFLQVLQFRIISDQPQSFVTPSPYPNLDVIASHDELNEIEDKLMAKHKIYKLRDTLKVLSEDYDVIYIDTAPALNFYTMSALIAAESCIIPFDCDDFSRKALYRVIEHIAEIRDDHNPDLEIEGIVVNQFQARANFPQQIVDELIEERLPVLSSYLSSSVKMRESHEQHKPMIHFAPNHRLTEELLELFEELS